MKTYILKLTTGEEIMGKVDIESSDEYYNVVDPMLVVGSRDIYGEGAMKLRDALLLSDDAMLSIPSKHVILYYEPMLALQQYYDVAVDYSSKYTKPEISKQINDATMDIREGMRAEEKASKSLAELITKMQQTKKLH